MIKSLHMFDKNLISKENIGMMSPQKLAFIGDAVYELMVRQKIISNNEGNIGNLNALKVKNVCCTAQSELYEKIKNSLTEEENEIYKRGRNAYVSHSPKNISPAIYHRATGIEALFGYLYLNSQLERLNEFINLLSL